MRRYDDQLGQAFLDRYHAQQVFTRTLRIRIGVAGYPRSLLAKRNSFQLPYEVANKGVARSVVQRHEYNHAPGSVTWRGYNYDRAITVEVVAVRKSELRARFEPILLISYAGKESAKPKAITFPDELGFLRCHPHRHAWKVGQAADVVPMRMGQKNGT